MTEWANINKEEVLELLNDWFGVSDYNTVMEELGELKQRIFNGCIELPQFFKNNETDAELPTYRELLQELEKDSWNLKVEDNTYNYCGFLERELDYKVIQAENSDRAIAFFAVHTGVDIRGVIQKRSQ